MKSDFSQENHSTDRFYSSYSTIYRYLFDYPPYIKRFRSKAVKEMNLEEGDKVAEIGCGTGANFKHIKDEIGETGEIIGVDVSKGMLEQAEKKAERNNWNNVELIHGDGAEIGLDEELDAVLFSWSINFFEPSEIIDKWSEKIKDGNIVIVHGSEPEGKLKPLLSNLIIVFNILTRPPVLKFRYEDSKGKQVEKNIQKIHKKLEKISEEVEKTTMISGMVEIDSGKIKNGS